MVWIEIRAGPARRRCHAVSGLSRSPRNVTGWSCSVQPHDAVGLGDSEKIRPRIFPSLMGSSELVVALDHHLGHIVPPAMTPGMFAAGCSSTSGVGWSSGREGTEETPRPSRPAQGSTSRARLSNYGNGSFTGRDDRTSIATDRAHLASANSFQPTFHIRHGTASQIWQGRLYFRPRGRDFVVVSFFEGKTDGFETD